MAGGSETLGLRGLLQRLGRRVAGGSPPLPKDAESPPSEGSSEELARRALAMMIDEAVGVLEAAGLPHRPGFYQRDPHRMEWTFLSSSMTAAERWATVLETPAGEGWRYATLPQLVRQERPEEEAVRQAAEILEQGAACLAVADQATSSGFEAAVRLAVAWADFQVARIVPITDRHEPLRLYFPPDDLAPATKGSGKARAPRRSKPRGAG